MEGTTILTDSTLDDVLNGKKPALVLFTNGDGLRGDFVTAFKKAIPANGGIVFAEVDPTKNPQAAERFGVVSKPVLVGWYNGEEHARRARPWGTDVNIIIETLQNAMKANGTNEKSQEDKPSKENVVDNLNIANDKPVKTTVDNFEDVILKSEQPVLIDFWAEWCGPCRMVAPILDKLAGEFAGQIRIAKINVDEEPLLGQIFQASAIPLMVAIKDGVMVFNQPGALPEPQLRNLVQQIIDLDVPQDAIDQSKDQWERVKEVLVEYGEKAAE